jgi:hypothetical protein
MKVKKQAMKSVEELDSNFTRSTIDQLLDGLPEEEEALHNLAPQGEGLVPSKFYDGGLTPIIDNYLPAGFTLTEQEKKNVTQGVKRLSSGLRASMPITCYGDKCPFKLQCPLHQQLGRVPEGKPCPIEGMLLDQYTKRYIDEFDVKSDAMSEVTTMTMLASTHVMEMRAFILLGKDENENPDGLIKNVVGFNSDEEPIIQLQEHPAFNIIERAWRWRKNLLESLVGTRKEKYKRDAVMGTVGPASVSTAASDMRSTIEKLTIIDISDDD